MRRFTFNDEFSNHYIDFKNPRVFFVCLFVLQKLQVIVSAQIEAHKEDKLSKRGYPIVSEYQ